MIDDGELDWKMIAINSEDPLFAKLNDIEDVETVCPGTVSGMWEIASCSFYFVTLILGFLQHIWVSQLNQNATFHILFYATFYGSRPYTVSFHCFISGIREWFRWYKTPDDKPLNAFGFDEKCLNKKAAEEVIEETHEFYMNLKNGKTEKGKLWLA